MKTLTKLPLCILLAALAGCVAPGPSLTPLELQSLQTRDYEAGKALVFNSAISVFQDLGYTVESADRDTGFITASSAAASAGGFWALLSDVTRVSQTKATAFVEVIGKRTRLRFNFVVTEETSTEHGQADREDTPILDPQIYQNAFERVENAIFIRQAN